MVCQSTGQSDAVAELRPRLEPFGTEAQRDHLEVDGGPADAAPGVVGAEFDRVLAGGNSLVQPVQLVLLALVGSEVGQRPPERPGVEGDHREAGFRQLRGEHAAAAAGADDGEVDRVAVADARASERSRHG